MALLFTGACGYIGSHTARAFLEKTKENIIIVDDLSTGFLEHLKALERVTTLIGLCLFKRI